MNDEHGTKCYFCDEPAMTVGEYADGKTHHVCAGCNDAFVNKLGEPAESVATIDEHEFGECVSCGEYAKLHWGGLIVGGRDYGDCRICDDCAISDTEYAELVAAIDVPENVMRFIDRTVEHMARYINNRNKRTGQTWHVIERYDTNGLNKRVPMCDEWATYQRAVIENEHGERVRLFYDYTFWRVA